MYWGGLSDRIGRKPVLLLGCAGTMFSLLIVGMSTNFWIALFGRCIGGLLNGNGGKNCGLETIMTLAKHTYRRGSDHGRRNCNESQA